MIYYDKEEIVFEERTGEVELEALSTDFTAQIREPRKIIAPQI